MKARDMFIRELVINDIPLLIQRFCFPWTTKEITEEKWNKYLAEQQNKVRTVFIIENEETILGYASLLYSSDYSNFADRKIPEIQDLWIDEAHRNAGFGTILIQHVESFAKEKSYKKIGLGVGLYKDYGAAQQLYPKLGYLPDGCGITYKTKFVTPGESYPVDDELILWLTKTL
jgi:GNAT superfamily N-acetyltransferase